MFLKGFKAVEKILKPQRLAPLEKYDTNDRSIDHLHRNAAIVNNRSFENSIVKIQGNAEGEMANSEKVAVENCKIPTTAASVIAATPASPEIRFSREF